MLGSELLQAHEAEAFAVEVDAVVGVFVGRTVGQQVVVSLVGGESVVQVTVSEDKVVVGEFNKRAIGVDVP